MMFWSNRVIVEIKKRKINTQSESCRGGIATQAVGLRYQIRICLRKLLSTMGREVNRLRRRLSNEPVSAASVKLFFKFVVPS